MKYWLLTSEYPPFFGGGIGTYCAITARMLSENDHHVTVFVSDNAVNDITIVNQDKIRIIRFNPSRTKSSAFLGHVTNLSYEYAHIVKHFVEKEGKPDCIETQEYLGIGYYHLQFKYLLYDWCKDIPVVVTMHSPSFLYMEYNHVPMYRYPNYWICEMERFCLQAADLVISPSRYMLQELRKRYTLTNNNIAIVSNPFGNVDNDNNPQSEPGSADQIVFYGKLTPQKGAFRLLAYFKKLWDEGFERPLHLLGGQDIVYHPEGATMGDIIRKKYRHYIDKGLLKFEGAVRPSEIAQRLSKAQVVIIPSDNDNQPYVVFEMMALGKTVLVSRQGGQAEVVEDGKDGFIFDHEVPDTFFTQLHKVLALNEESKGKIATAATRKIATNHNTKLVYEQKLALIKKLIDFPAEGRSEFPLIRPRNTAVDLVEDRSTSSGLLSIVVPYFNMGNYIADTIQSLQNATYSQKEIIIINDGSTDSKSLAALDQYRGKENIRVVDVTNGGLGKARNLGAEMARGEYLAFLDADDTVHPDYYQRAITILRHYGNIHFAGCWIQYFGTSESVWPAFSPEPPLILYHNLVNSSSLVYKKVSFIAGGKNDHTMIFPGMEDYDSVISMLSKGLNGIVIPETLFNYRIRPDSMIRAISRSKKLNLYQHITKKHESFYASFATDTFNLLNANGPAITMDNPSLDYHLADNLPFSGRLTHKAIALIKRNEWTKKMAYKVYRILKKK